LYNENDRFLKKRRDIMKVFMVNIGYGNVLPVDKIVAILNINSAPIRKLVQDAKEKDMLINASQGRKTRSVIVMESGHIVLSSVQTETLVSRMSIKEDMAYKKEE